jgi:hypothetical protein
MSHTAGERNHIADGSDPGIRATVTADGALKVDGSAVTQPIADIPNTAAMVSGALGALDDAVTIDAHGYQTVSFCLSAIPATLSCLIESSPDNSTWTDRTVYALSVVGTVVSTISFSGTSDSAYSIQTCGIRYWRIRCSAYTSGTVNVSILPAVTGMPMRVIAAGAATSAADGASGSAANCVMTTARLYASNGTTWDRLRLSAASDTKANPSYALDVNSHIHGWNSAGTQWRRIHTGSATADALNFTGLNQLDTRATIFGFNGTTWDRLRSSTGFGLQVDATRQATYYGKVPTYAVISQGAAGTTQLIAADAAKKHKLLGFTVALDVAGTVAFTDGTISTGAIPLTAGNPLVVPNSLLPFCETSAVNKALSIVTTGGKAFGMAMILSEA